MKKAILAFYLGALCILRGYAVSAETLQSQIDWSIDEVKKITNNLRASESLNPVSWKNGHKVAVLFAFDVDNETLFISPGAKDKIPISQFAFAEYGANVGMKRIVDILEREKVPATFFIPAMMLEIHPETISQVQRLESYEVGVHGWIHEYNANLPSYEVEKSLIEKSLTLLTEKFGKAPVGYRAPSWNFSPFTLDVIKSLGFLYDSSLMARDDPYEICEQSAGGMLQPTGVLELPVNWILDDFPLLNSWPGGGYIAPRDVLQIYKDEFDRAYVEGGMFSLTMHPHVIGRRSRILILEELINYIKTKEGVWFTTHAEAANYVRKMQGKSPASC